MDSNQAKSGYPKLDISRLSSQISQVGWLEPLIFEQVTSTNDFAIANLEQINSAQGIVVVADEQTAGRGRLDRSWVAPAGSGIAMSLGVKMQSFAVELSAVPLICGLAVNRALKSFGITSYLKWPNDIVFSNTDLFPSIDLSEQGTVTDGFNKKAETDLRKVGGVLVQLVQDSLIIGIGLNVTLKSHDLPVPHATSLHLEGFEVDRIELICKVLEEINFLQGSDISWLAEYSKNCVTLGKTVSVTNFSNQTVTGLAQEVLPTGALLLKNLENFYQITVGDIVHLAVESS